MGDGRIGAGRIVAGGMGDSRIGAGGMGDSGMTGLRSEFLYHVDIEVDELLEVGDTYRGRRTIVRIKGGSFEGPRLRGEVLPGTADWFLVRPDGVGEGDVRDTYRTHDGHLIFVSYRGLLRADPEVWARVMAGEPVDPAEYYFRSTPGFETASETYGWLNGVVAVGVGRQRPMSVSYDVYEIL